jgi:phage tail sheath protein FI
MLHPATPGAYLQRLDSTSHAIASVRTDIPGLIGIAERGPLDTPVAVETFKQFQGVFGNFIGAGFLAYSVRAFFENGGQRARVVRVASRDPIYGAAPASCIVLDENGAAGWTVSATSPGTWGNALAVAILPKMRAQAAVDLTQSTAEYAVVASTAGIAPLTLVRIRQFGAIPVVRIVTAIDPVNRLVYWINPDPNLRRPFELTVSGLDPAVPTIIESVDYDLMVWSSGRLAAVYQQLSLVPANQLYAPIMLAEPDYTVQDGLPAPAPLVTIGAPVLTPDQIPVPLDVVADALLPLGGGRDGLALLTPEDFIGDPLVLTDGGDDTPRGLASLAHVTEVSMLAAPDILVRPVEPPIYLPRPVLVDPCAPCGPSAQPATPVPIVVGELPPVFDDDQIYAVQAAMIAQAEALRDRIVIIDPPFDVAADDRVGVAPVLAWRNRFDSAFGALYFPWIAAPDPLNLAPTRALPPSGHVAGQIAANDLAFGVHHAPANKDIAWIQDLTVAVNAPTHGYLNTAGINVVRAEFGRPFRILGARTVSSDPTWRFLNVRRLVSMIRAALDVSTQWAVFEPNNTATRSSITSSVASFLTQLWKQGALVGDVPSAAFLVQCDDGNNPPSLTAVGELHVDIAIAPSVPFEFIILRLGRSADSLDIVERGAQAAGVA